MATSQQGWEEIAQAGPAPTEPNVSASTDARGAEQHVLDDQESASLRRSAAGSLGNPEPGMRGSEEELFSQEETVIPPEAAGQATVASSPQHSSDAEGSSSGGTAVSGATGVREFGQIPGLPPFFPPPRSTARDTPPGVHRGPASSSSISSGRPPFQLNPRAQEFTNVAHLFLQRGNQVQPEALDPMDQPHDNALGVPLPSPESIERRRRDAIYHAAMVWRRLTAADLDAAADDLDGHFTRLFGEEYEDERTRVMMEEPNDPSESEEEEEEAGDDHDANNGA